MSADTHTEIESKFDVPGDVTIPDLATVGGVATVGDAVVQELDAGGRLVAPPVDRACEPRSDRRWRSSVLGWSTVDVPQHGNDKISI